MPYWKPHMNHVPSNYVQINDHILVGMSHLTRITRDVLLWDCQDMCANTTNETSNNRHPAKKGSEQGRTLVCGPCL